MILDKSTNKAYFDSLYRLADNVNIEDGHLLISKNLPAFFDAVTRKIKELESIIETQIPALQKVVLDCEIEIYYRDTHIDDLNEKINAYESTLQLIREIRKLKN